MIDIAKGERSGAEYFKKLSGYLTFAFFAILVIIFWVFIWIFWVKKCLCFQNVFGDYIDKVFVWWLSWIFLCGILACCIAGFVTANRYGFALNGVQCAYERIYYDSIYGQLKETYPRFEGLENINYTIDSLIKLTELEPITMDLFYKNFDELSKDLNYTFQGKEDYVKNLFTYPFPKSISEFLLTNYNVSATEQNNINETLNIILKEAYSGINNYIQLYNNGKYLKNATETLSNLKSKFISISTNFAEYESKFIKDFNYYANVAYHWGKTVPMIYFYLLLMFVVISGALLITYYCTYCLNFNQKFWIIPMHIAWNGICFFMFSFFMYGCAYGMLYLGAIDSIGYLNYTFSEENLESNDIVILPNASQEFLSYCLLSKPNYFKNKSELVILNDFINNAIKLEAWENLNCPNLDSNKSLEKVCDDLFNDTKTNYNKYIENFTNETQEFKDLVEQTGNIYANFNCSFIHNNINLMLNALWDFAWETRILCALSCCIGFFGIFAVCGFLWSIHLWEKQERRPLMKNRKLRKVKIDNSGSDKDSDDS